MADNKFDALELDLNLATKHYENFPVAMPIVVPSNYRIPLKYIYAFARSADDIADEAEMNLNKTQRLELLERYIKNLDNPETNFFYEFKEIINKYNLSISACKNLITAFKQDVTKSVYRDHSEVLNYCCNSANPVGQLMLEIMEENTTANLELSNKICTGLQLINFLQDWYSDLIERKRCYIPLNSQEKFNLSLNYYNSIHKLYNHNKLIDLLSSELDFAKNIFYQGSTLGNNIKGRMGFNLRLIINSGKMIIKKLSNRTDPYFRPKIKFYDWIGIFYASIRGF